MYAILMEHGPSSEVINASPDTNLLERQHRALLPEITLYPSKRPRLNMPLAFSPVPAGVSAPALQPVHDHVADCKYLRKVLVDLSRAKAVPGSYGKATNWVVRRLLERAEQPNTDSRSGVVEA